MFACAYWQLLSFFYHIPTTPKEQASLQWHLQEEVWVNFIAKRRCLASELEQSEKTRQKDLCFLCGKLFLFCCRLPILHLLYWWGVYGFWEGWWEGSEREHNENEEKKNQQNNESWKLMTIRSSLFNRAVMAQRVAVEAKATEKEFSHFALSYLLRDNYKPKLIFHPRSYWCLMLYNVNGWK